MPSKSKKRLPIYKGAAYKVAAGRVERRVASYNYRKGGGFMDCTAIADIHDITRDMAEAELNRLAEVLEKLALSYHDADATAPRAQPRQRPQGRDQAEPRGRGEGAGEPS